MIEAKNLVKTFGNVKAVNGISFEARDGAITGLLGPNGAGKTSTLRMLYGMLKPDEGDVLVDQLSVHSSPLEARRRLGVLPDEKGLYKRLTARENIAYFGQLHGLDNKSLVSRINDLTNVLDMHDFIDRRTDGFSQGQRGKVALARALIHQPQNLLLDEPTNGLDVMSTRAMRRFLISQKAEGRCIVFSSHIMQEVAALCDEIFIVAKGKLVARGNTEELKLISGCDDLEDAFVKLVGMADEEDNNV